MKGPVKPPTEAEFKQAAREAFRFLLPFGFVEVPPPSHRSGNPFELWFRAGDRSVVITGEGYGTAAAVTLDCDDLELAEIYLVPKEQRPAPWRKGAREVGQLEQLRAAAGRLEQHGADFLGGDLKRFRALAKPLPPYKRPTPTST